MVDVRRHHTIAAIALGKSREQAAQHGVRVTKFFAMGRSVIGRSAQRLLDKSWARRDTAGLGNLRYAEAGLTARYRRASLVSRGTW